MRGTRHRGRRPRGGKPFLVRRRSARAARAASPRTQPALDEHALRALLERVRQGKAGVAEAVAKLKGAPFEHIGAFATLDTHRALRTGMPEVVFAEGKTAAQVASIAKELALRGPLLVTRLAPDQAGAARRAVRGSIYDPVSRTLRKGRMQLPVRGPVAVCCAGTSDIPVCEEAAATLDVMGVEVVKVYDVGVAGLHRVLARRADLDRCTAIVVAAGMEGALPSVVGGLVGKPVVGVPTSIGYGASLSGLASLLAMLNSCAPNVTVVNIDNGFGAGFVAGLIARE